ncbi:MAG: carbohydrate ABC transporter permease [Actinobacteria bacterium]|nr:carbohydrate ABC transporter permease [Actinomycetota bacterium]
MSDVALVLEGPVGSDDPPRRGTPVGRTIKIALLFVFVIFFLLPVILLLLTSFKSLSEADPSTAWNLPKHWTLDAWQQAWDALHVGLWNSFKLVIPATIISTMLGSVNGFVLSRWRFPGADVVFTMFLFGMFIPYQAVMIPLGLLFNDVGVDPGLGRLIIAHVVYGIPITTLIFRNYYATTIPNELIEAARMDGAGLLRTYTSVILPASPPAFVVTAIWQFTSIWNDFLFAVFLVTNPNSWPVTVALNNTAGSQVTPFPVQMAGALIASLPTLLVYILLGRYFMRGLMAGALKG